MELKAWAGHLHLIDYLLILEQALKFPICGPLYVLFFHSRVSPTPVDVPVEILWNSQTSPHLLSPVWSLDGMRHPSSRSIEHMAPKDLLYGRGEYKKYRNNSHSLWNRTNPVTEEDWLLPLRSPQSTGHGAQHADGCVKAGYSPVLASTTVWLWTPARPHYQLLRLCPVPVGWLLGGSRNVLFGGWRWGVQCHAGYLFATISLKENSTNIY